MPRGTSPAIKSMRPMPPVLAVSVLQQMTGAPTCVRRLFDREQTECGKVLETLTASGVRYSVEPGEALSVTAGGQALAIDQGWSKIYGIEGVAHVVLVDETRGMQKWAEQLSTQTTNHVTRENVKT